MSQCMASPRSSGKVYINKAGQVSQMHRSTPNMQAGAASVPSSHRHGAHLFLLSLCKAVGLLVARRLLCAPLGTGLLRVLSKL
eukprot:363221-Chlamydomonas_euryale.AAC.28